MRQSRRLRRRSTLPITVKAGPPNLSTQEMLTALVLVQGGLARNLRAIPERDKAISDIVRFEITRAAFEILNNPILMVLRDIDRVLVEHGIIKKYQEDPLLYCHLLQLKVSKEFYQNEVDKVRLEPHDPDFTSRVLGPDARLIMGLRVTPYNHLVTTRLELIVTMTRRQISLDKSFITTSGSQEISHNEYNNALASDQNTDNELLPYTDFIQDLSKSFMEAAILEQGLGLRPFMESVTRELKLGEIDLGNAIHKLSAKGQFPNP